MQKSKYLLSISFLMFIVISCKQEVKVQLPFEEEKVISILGDMHFAKSASMIHKVEERDSLRLLYESQVYKIHEITKKEYNELKYILESDLNLFYKIEKKVHKHLKSVQNDKK